MSEQQRSDPVVNNILETPQHVSAPQAKQAKTDNKPTRQHTSFSSILQSESVIFGLQVAIVVLFIIFISRLCFNRKPPKGPRIIRGSGTGSNINSRRVLNSSSRKSNHRHGMKTPQLNTWSDQQNSGNSEDERVIGEDLE